MPVRCRMSADFDQPQGVIGRPLSVKYAALIAGAGRRPGGAGMTLRGGRLTRVTLRLVLLLGGVALAWGAHEIATAGAAQAADRPAPVSSPAHRVTDVHRPPPGPHRPALGPARRHPATGQHTRAGAPPTRWTPHRPPHVTAAPPPRHRPPRCTARHKPTDHRPATAGRPAPKPSAPDPLRPATRPAPAMPAQHPATGVLRPGPVGTGVPGPDPGVLRPVPEPVGTDLPPPTARAPRPATHPLGPVLAPVRDGLEPVLGPVLTPGKPASDEPGRAPEDDSAQPADDPGQPVKDDPGQPVKDDPALPTEPAAVPPAVPAPAAGPIGPIFEIRPVVFEATDRVSRAGQAPSASLRTEWSFTAVVVALRTGQPGQPVPLGSGIAAGSGTHTPGTTGSASAGHGELAEATARDWAPPAQSGRPCRDAGDRARPSRSPRPGTRPA